MTDEFATLLPHLEVHRSAERFGQSPHTNSGRHDLAPVQSHVDMHVHACYIASMRTTIEISDEQRAGLLAIAAERGLKGFSPIVQEALTEYLATRSGDTDRIAAALAKRGALDQAETDELRQNCRQIRDNWR